MLGSLSAQQAEDKSEPAPPPQAKQAEIKKPPEERHNVMADVIFRHEQITNRVKK